MHYNIEVFGKVQGVWFRKYTQQLALEIGIKGFVKNMPSSSVYAEAEGTEAQLKLFLKGLKKGSPLSKVNDIKFEEDEMRNFFEFKINR